MFGHRSEDDRAPAQIAIRGSAAFAMTAALAVGIFFAILFIVGTG